VNNFFLEKGVKVIRSPSEIIALIKSYDNTTKSNLSKDVQRASHSLNNCVTPLLQLPQNVSDKILKPLDTKRLFKSNINVPLEVSESKDQQECKMVVNVSPNNLRSKKLVSH